MKLVAFSGKAQAGKTTSALHAISVFGGTKIALGDAVKEEVAEFLTQCGVPFEQRHLYGTAADREERLYTNVANWRWSNSDHLIRTILNDHLEIDVQKRTGSITSRKLLQLWGTEYRRAQCESYWCDHGKEKILKTEGLIFIDDIRFPDEVDMIRSEGGVVIRLERPGGSRIATPDHPSETALDGYKGFDATIINAGDVTDLRESVEGLLRLIL